MPITIPSGRTLPLKAKTGGGFESFGLTPPVGGAASLIFEENFDSLPDWTAEGLLTDQQDVPAGSVWTAGRSQSLWGPGGMAPLPGRHSTIEILASNADKSRSGTGKSFVKYREPADTLGTSLAGWNSDGILMKLLDQPRAEVYVEWHMRVSPELIADYNAEEMGGSGKVVRILGMGPELYDKTNPPYFFDFFDNPEDYSSPKYLYDQGSRVLAYKMRQAHSMGPRGQADISGIVQGVPYGTSNGTNMSFGQSGMDSGRPDGSTARLIDQLTGAPMVGSGGMDMAQLYGADGSVWLKMASYVKINSAPGVADGELMHWVEGQRILHFTSIPWIEAGFPYQLWNYVGIGGNDYSPAGSRRFTYSSAEKVQEAGFTSVSGELYVFKLTNYTPLVEGVDYTVSGTTVTLTGSNVVDGNQLLIHEGRQTWYAIDDVKAYDGIPDGVEH